MTAGLVTHVEALFALASTVALVSWCALIVLPRTPLLRASLLVVGVAGPCLLYATLVQLAFFSVPGGGFGTVAAVQALFRSPEMALAGWVHYLAFDLFVGLWIAQRCDSEGVSRWLQAPLLAATFVFGPIGLLMAFSLLYTRSPTESSLLRKMRFALAGEAGAGYSR